MSTTCDWSFSVSLSLASSTRHKVKEQSSLYRQPILINCLMKLKLILAKLSTPCYTEVIPKQTEGDDVHGRFNLQKSISAGRALLILKWPELQPGVASAVIKKLKKYEAELQTKTFMKTKWYSRNTIIFIVLLVLNVWIKLSGAFFFFSFQLDSLGHAMRFA